jgi:large subunit ribosomal protein L5e
MPFIKVVKNKAYYMRFQVKFRRRREGKTDYYARKRLIAQKKNKYNSPKYRLVVRFSNTDVICQIVYATLEGDIILAAAYGKELKHYGVKCGFKNYAAAYATGLLVARRALNKLKMDDLYLGVVEPTGEMYNVEEEGSRRPFHVLLDVGLYRTTTGSRLFAALKGAIDGGLSITHDNKRFVGYNSETEEFNPEILKNYIYGIHVAKYMEKLQADGDKDKLKLQFGEYLKEGITTQQKIVDMYKNAHKKIRETPVRPKKERREKGHYIEKWRPQRKNTKTRRNRIKQKLENLEKLAQQENQQQ